MASRTGCRSAPAEPLLIGVQPKAAQKRQHAWFHGAVFGTGARPLKRSKEDPPVLVDITARLCVRALEIVKQFVKRDRIGFEFER
jgi:hypothetical protein